MPRPGQKSITVPEETDRFLRESFSTYEQEVKRDGIFSVPQLIHRAVANYVEELATRQRRKAFEGFMGFFNRRPDLLKKMGFQSSGQLLEELIRDYTKAEKPVSSK
ncbi:MAG: hypothetical protein FJ358_02065 [Thaumarchaeota archaeon]|nr:hypothetical protein [Nitrososphaerota archaeon]